MATTSCTRPSSRTSARTSVGRAPCRLSTCWAGGWGRGRRQGGHGVEAAARGAGERAGREAARSGMRVRHRASGPRRGRTCCCGWLAPPSPPAGSPASSASAGVQPLPATRKRTPYRRRFSAACGDCWPCSAELAVWEAEAASRLGSGYDSSSMEAGATKRRCRYSPLCGGVRGVTSDTRSVIRGSSSPAAKPPVGHAWHLLHAVACSAPGACTAQTAASPAAGPHRRC